MTRVRLIVAFLLIAGAGVSCAGGEESYPVTAYFQDVGDLVTGAQVQVLDVEIGRVTDVDLELRGSDLVARVEMSVTPRAPLHVSGMGALIRQTSLLGEQFVQLVPGETGMTLAEAGSAEVALEETDRRVDVETFLSDLSSFIGGGGLEDLNRFTHAQALILEDRGERLGQTLEELERFTGVLAARKVDLGAAIDSLSSASGTLARNRSTIIDFVDSLAQANALLADQGDELQHLFRSLRRFGSVSTRFLARHEQAIERQFEALRPVFRSIAKADGALRADVRGLRRFFQLFPKSLGGGPGGEGAGDYIQIDAVLCEQLIECNTRGEKGDVPGEGR